MIPLAMRHDVAGRRRDGQQPLWHYGNCRPRRDRSDRAREEKRAGF
jgi:hypothetical protein